MRFTLDSYAQCIPAPVERWALAYSRTDSAQITIPVPDTSGRAAFRSTAYAPVERQAEPAGRLADTGGVAAVRAVAALGRLGTGLLCLVLSRRGASRTP